MNGFAAISQALNKAQAPGVYVAADRAVAPPAPGGSTDMISSQSEDTAAELARERDGSIGKIVKRLGLGAVMLAMIVRCE